MEITQLSIYPVKSLGGVALQKARLTLKGLEFDRIWMLVKPDGMMLTQREIPEMALIKIKDAGADFHLESSRKPGNSILLSKSNPGSGEKMKVQIFDDIALADCMDAKLDHWFSEILGLKCRLVKMPENGSRISNATENPVEFEMSFADSKPFLLLNERSLEFLNQRLEKKVGMDRFRPNLVFGGQSAFEEDQWKEFAIGSSHFNIAKPCGRCQIPTINQETAEMGKEPTKTLNRFRSFGNKVLFGMYANWVPGEPGQFSEIHVGDIIIPD